MLPRSLDHATSRGPPMSVGHGFENISILKSDPKVGSIWAAGSDRQPPAVLTTARRRSEFQMSELRTPIEFRAACGHGLTPISIHIAFA
jgi:hypothetical protein